MIRNQPAYQAPDTRNSLSILQLPIFNFFKIEHIYRWCWYTYLHTHGN